MCASPVPSTATVRPPASRAAVCAAVSIPAARPGHDHIAMRRRDGRQSGRGRPTPVARPTGPDDGDRARRLRLKPPATKISGGRSWTPRRFPDSPVEHGERADPLRAPPIKVTLCRRELVVSQQPALLVEHAERATQRPRRRPSTAARAAWRPAKGRPMQHFRTRQPPREPSAGPSQEKWCGA